MDEIVARIIKRMEDVGYDQKTFAAEIGVSPVTITDWKTGKSRSYMKKINIISAALSSPLGWIIFGEGPESKIEQAWEDGTLPGAPGYQESKAETNSGRLTVEEQELLAAYQQADERSRAMVRLALGLDDDMAIAARGGKVVKKPNPVSAETLDELSRATEDAAKKENERF